MILIDNHSSAVQCSMILIDDHFPAGGWQEKRRGGGDFARLDRGDLEGGTARQVADHLGGGEDDDHHCLDVARDVDHGG